MDIPTIEHMFMYNIHVPYFPRHPVYFVLWLNEGQCLLHAA